MTHDVGPVSHHPDKIVGKILWMGGHEADAWNAKVGNAAEQLGKGHVPSGCAVGIDVLSQEHDLLHTVFPEGLRLPQDVGRSARTFASPDIGDDAVGAVVVAPVHDGKVGLDIALAADGQPFGDGAFVLRNIDHPFPVCDHPEKHLRYFVHIAGAEGDIHEGILFQQLFGHARLLDHASAYADEHLRPLFAYFLQPCDVAKGLALSVVPDAAGVVHHKVRFPFVTGRAHAHAFQDPCQLFGIMGVHLAAVGHDIIGFRTPGQGGK